MDNFMIFAISLGIVIGMGLFFKAKKEIQTKKSEEKMAAKKNTPQRLRNPNIRRVK